MKAVTTVEAAARLGVTLHRVRAMINAGTLRAEKIGRDWLIEEHSLQAVLSKPRKRGRPPKSK